MPSSMVRYNSAFPLCARPRTGDVCGISGNARWVVGDLFCFYASRIACLMFAVISDTADSLVWILVPCSTLPLVLLIKVSIEHGTFSRDVASCAVVHLVVISIGVGFLARFALSKISYASLVRIIVVVVLIIYFVNFYQIFVLGRSPWRVYSCGALRHEERSRLPVVRATDVENGDVPAADVA